jgi:glutaminyl-peptide cyclotransferase
MHPTRPLPSSGWDSPRPSRSRRSRSLWLSAVALALVVGCGSEEAQQEFTGDRAWQYLLSQCDIGPRPPGSAEHDRTVDFIVARLKECGAKVTLQRFKKGDPYADRTLTFTNIIGSYSPDRKKRILLAAHYDTRPWADREESDSLRAIPIMGANDGASGVAVLLEIADMLAVKTPTGVGIDLVFFDGEDYGKEGDLEHYLIGSRHFAANLGGYRPACAIVLDMVGAAGARILQEGNSLGGARELTEELYRRAATLGLDVFVDRRGDSIYDDHIPLLLAGIPTVDLIGFPYEYWHTLEDTPEKCSRETLRQVGVLVADVLYNFSF